MTRAAGAWKVMGAGPFRVESEGGEVIARLESHLAAEASLIASAPSLLARVEELEGVCAELLDAYCAERDRRNETDLPPVEECQKAVALKHKARAALARGAK